MSLILKCPISVGWNRGVPLYMEVHLFQGVGIEGLAFKSFVF